MCYRCSILITQCYLGPGSFLSICSKSGIEWAIEKTGFRDFGQIARSLNIDVSRALKLSTPLSTSSREPEPDEDTAWLFSTAYFEADPDSTYGIVHRPTFENMLRTHFRKVAQSDEDSDPGWYALRNVVYAAGCRIVEVKAASKTTQKSVFPARSWRYFLNALAQHNDLLYYKTSLMAVQALAAMVSSC